MFAITRKLAALALIAGSALTPAHAADTDATIPVTVDLSEVRTLDGPLYISIQTEGEYRSMEGHGGIVEPIAGLPAQITYKVPMPGRYAVSIWHDLDSDQKFSMDDSYRPLDGWGASGEVSERKNPSFDDVAVTIPSYGTDVAVTIFYPDE